MSLLFGLPLQISLILRHSFSRSHWLASLNFEHRYCERVLHSVFVGWHIVELYAICSVVWSRYFVSTALASSENLSTNRVLLRPSLLTFSYYSTLAVDGEFWSLIFAVAQGKLAICNAVKFPSPVCDGASDIFALDYRLALSFGCLVGIEKKLSEFDWTDGYLFRRLCIWFRDRQVCSYLIEDAVNRLGQVLVCCFELSAPFQLLLRDRLRSLSCRQCLCDIRWSQNVSASTCSFWGSLNSHCFYMKWRPTNSGNPLHCVEKVSLPDSFTDEPVLSPVDDIDVPCFVARLVLAPRCPGTAQPGFAEWSKNSSLEPLSFGNSGYPCSLATVATGQDVFSSHLDHKMAEVVLVAFSFIELLFLSPLLPESCLLLQGLSLLRLLPPLLLSRLLPPLLMPRLL